MNPKSSPSRPLTPSHPLSANVVPQSAPSIEQRIAELEPDLVWRHLWTGRHEVRDSEFELHVCRIVEGGQLRIYVFKDGVFTTYMFDPEHDPNIPAGSAGESANVADLISAMLWDIDSNHFDMY